MAGIDVATTLYRDEEGYPVAELSAGLGRRIAGYLTLTRMSESDLTPDCARNFSRLRRDDGDDGLGVVAVSNVRVEPWARSQGVGAALYEEAARVARRNFRSAIVSHECVGGQTSPDARRVWDSSRFRSAVDVRGTVALARAPMQRNPSRRSKHRNPDNGDASRVYHMRFDEREWRVSPEELVWHMRMAESANYIAKNLAAFSREYPDARLMTDDERATLAAAERILNSVAIPRSMFTVVERRIPAKYPGKR